MQTSFMRSLTIQSRVIGALLMREIITRYGRNNIGFLWLFVEPLLITVIILLLWRAIKADHISNLPIVAFMLTGYPLAMMWRNGANRVANAISANQSLLYHRNVRILDVLLARILLEVAGASVALVSIIGALVAIGWMAPPHDLFYMVLAWLLMSWFALALGLLLSTLIEQYELASQLWRVVSILLFPLSGVFYLVDALPHRIQEIVLWFPMVHGVEMMRHGYFGPLIHTHENPWFLMAVNIVFMFVGLLLVQRFGRGVEPL